ncbi:MAG: NADH-quinone oxidoreductase subunit A [bacterium]
MFRDYLPVVLQAAAALAIAIGAIVASILLGAKTKHNPAKDTAYECGQKPIGPAHTRFTVRFYLVAMLFLLFDIELLFIYPWAVAYANMLIGPIGLRALWAMLAFILIIEVGHLYAYKKGAFDWNAPKPQTPVT